MLRKITTFVEKYCKTTKLFCAMFTDITSFSVCYNSRRQTHQMENAHGWGSFKISRCLIV